MIRRVCDNDKKHVLAYCAETFGWGDYIHDAWDSWIKNGIFLACESPDKNKRTPCGTDKTSPPVGICHIHLSEDQMWLEGMRIHPQYRRRGLATLLVRHAENMALGCTGLDAKTCTAFVPRHRAGETGISVSRMLIDTKNRQSLEMARRLGYSTTHTWKYYRATLQLPMRARNYSADALAVAQDSKAALYSDVEICRPLWNLNPLEYSHYVRSWRWHKTNPATLQQLASENMIAVARPRRPSCNDGNPRSHTRDHTVSILSVSESVDHPSMALYAAVYPGSDARCTGAMVSYLADVAVRHACKVLNIFVQSVLPLSGHVTNLYDFHLVEKRLFHPVRAHSKT